MSMIPSQMNAKFINLSLFVHHYLQGPRSQAEDKTRIIRELAEEVEEEFLTLTEYL